MASSGESAAVSTATATMNMKQQHITSRCVPPGGSGNEKGNVKEIENESNHHPRSWTTYDNNDGVDCVHGMETTMTILTERNINQKSKRFGSQSASSPVQLIEGGKNNTRVHLSDFLPACLISSVSFQAHRLL